MMGAADGNFDTTDIAGNSQRKLLTVLVPAYNAEAYIGKTLTSLCVREILDEIEILVVNDGSTDRTGRIAERYARRYPESFRVIDQENGGHGSGINRGIREASGAYFKVVDADDWVERKAFIKLVDVLRKQASKGCGAGDFRAGRQTEGDLVAGKQTEGKRAAGKQPTRARAGNSFEERPADIVYSGFLWAIEQKKRDSLNSQTRYRLKAETPEPFRNVEYGRTYLFDEIADRLYIKMHNMTIRTDILRDHGIQIDEHCYYVDSEYVLYPIPWVETICFVDAYVYRYRIGRQGQSVGIEKMRQQERDYDRVIISLLDFYNKLDRGKTHCSPEKKTYIAGIIARITAGKEKVMLSFPPSKEKKLELMEFDKRLKTLYPEIYCENRNLAVTILRRSRYLTYCPASILVRWRYRDR